MHIEQMRWTQGHGWEPTPPGGLGKAAQLVLLVGSRGVLKEQHHLDEIKRAYPRAHLLGCSTAGEIYATQVCDNSLVVTAIQFEATQIQGVRVKLSDGSRSFAAAQTSYEAVGSSSPDLAVLISCVGRKLVLKQRIEAALAHSK